MSPHCCCPGADWQVLKEPWSLFADKAQARRAELHRLEGQALPSRGRVLAIELTLWGAVQRSIFGGGELRGHAQGLSKLSAVTKGAVVIRCATNMATSIANYLRSSVLGKRPKPIRKGSKAAAAEAAVIATDAIAAANLAEIKRLAAVYEDLGGGALTMALAEEAVPVNPLREARERLRVFEGRPICRAGILTPPRTLPPRRLRLLPRRPPPRRPPPRKLLPRKLLLPRRPPRKPLPMHLARERPWRPSCRKSPAVARAA